MMTDRLRGTRALFERLTPHRPPAGLNRHYPRACIITQVYLSSLGPEKVRSHGLHD
jgi:hypothetical protein